MEQEIGRINKGAGQFVVSEIYKQRDFSRYYEGRAKDIKGGLEARQYGLVMLISQEIISAGVRLFLIDEDYIPISETMDDEVFRLGVLYGQSHCVYEKAWSLMCENPQSEEEIIAYANKCMEFVENELGMHAPKVIHGHRTDEERTSLTKVRADLASMGEFLNVKTPYSGRSRNSIMRIRKRSINS